MRLFISHASEDKADFVEPLVAALGKTYDVWYDKNDLTLGNSLLGKINEGLRSSDFGIVVLSPSYAKKWPMAELGGLFALETTTRKIILPIWKDLTHKEVTLTYPILADRFAVYASEGVEKVVDAIRLAVDASARQRELTGLQGALDRLKGLDETLMERRESAALLGTHEGAQLVRQATDALFVSIQTTLSASSATSGVLKFAFKRSDSVTFSVAGPFGLHMHLHVRRLAGNSAASALFQVTVFKDAEFRSDQNFEVITEQEFIPSFRRVKQVVWKDEASNRTLSNEELGAHALDVFRAEMERIGLGQ